MKFCYLDESGTGSEPILVVAGIIANALRMHITKEAWSGVLTELSKITKRTITEFHARDFYKGNGPWRTIDGVTRSNVIKIILDWLIDRKHSVVFSAILKSEYEHMRNENAVLSDLNSPWCTASMHCILSLQKYFQTEQKNKGNTVLIFDREDTQAGALTELVRVPPIWTGVYYSHSAKEPPLSQIVDVPYFADSEHVVLIQIADLITYLLRRHGELQDGLCSEKYANEKEKLTAWTKKIMQLSIPCYTAKRRDQVADLFWKIAPNSLRM